MRSSDRSAFADIGREIGHGLTPHLGDVARNLGGCLHEEVPQGTGNLNVVRPERDSDAFLGVVVLVDRVVAPISAVVVPDVVVGIRVLIFHAPTSTKGVRHPLSEG